VDMGRCSDTLLQDGQVVRSCAGAVSARAGMKGSHCSSDVFSIWNGLCQDALKGRLESERHVRMPAIINIYEHHLAITCHVVWHLADQ